MYTVYLGIARGRKKFAVEVGGGFEKNEETMMKMKVLLRGDRGWPMAKIEATSSGLGQFRS